MSQNANSGKAGLIGVCLMFVAAGIYSLFHNELHIVSPRQGFALSEPYKLAASVGLICLGLGVVTGSRLRDASDRNDLAMIIRVIVFAVGIGGALIVLLSFLIHYSLVWFG
ncbi:MAG TPA: hypothetical protein PLK30_27050 [Blastocatellia bacterium]|nr:hypothetical protein [Blastocatellia bacterium]